MEVLDINTFLSFKSQESLQSLDNASKELIAELFSHIDKKNKKNNKKNSNHVLKNQKLQNKKENIINKVNLILNKLSESNIDNLVIEFLENINQVEQFDYEEIQKTFYLKIISEINFVKIYLQFLNIIKSIYGRVQNYDLTFFISAIETKFNIDYTNYDICPENKFNFIKEIDIEQKRINNLTLIINLVECGLLSKDILEYCDSAIINQTIFLSDIYYWFNLRNRSLTEEEISKIKSHLLLSTNTRDNVLLTNLINNTLNTNIIEEPTQNITTTNNKPKVNTFILEIDNIIDEYILMNNYEDIVQFITDRCKDAISKNKFSEVLVDKYLLSKKEACNTIIELIKQLTKAQILFKTNIAKGISLIHGNWEEKSIDYIKPSDKMKGLLVTMKGLGIIKGIETILSAYKI